MNAQTPGADASDSTAQPIDGQCGDAQLHIVLFSPDIPQNTGNIGRTCAFVGARLHLIHPLGFEINDRQLRRAGMDYWRALDVHEHADWAAFAQSPARPKRLWLFTTKAKKSFWQATYAPGDGLVFGRETNGAPPWLHDAVGPEQSLYIDGRKDALRSLNLASSVAAASYEALRQLR